MPRQVIQWFSEKMEEKLQANDHKVDWINYPVDYLLMRLIQELDELKDALQEKEKPFQEAVEDAIKECADVSLFSMFIADQINHWANKTVREDRGK